MQQPSQILVQEHVCIAALHAKPAYSIMIRYSMDHINHYDLPPIIHLGLMRVPR